MKQCYDGKSDFPVLVR